MYNHAFKLTETSASTGDFGFHVVQVDDQGSFWDTDHAQEVLDEIDREAARRNTLVVLFIHGWHHNAAPDDDNLRNFRLSLKELHAELNDPPERLEFRAQHTGSKEVRIIGIYVGWRGRSLPSGADYFTFWGRKPTAERVGNGDVYEFIERLQLLYARENSPDPKRHRMGLVTVGHSFGGQVLWRALHRRLEIALVERNTALANQLNPAEAAPNPPPPAEPVSGFGDLNLLLNPALEAYQYARVDALYRRLTFGEDQLPQVVTFSANNDWARWIWFRLARWVSLIGRPILRGDNHGYQAQLYGQALGELRTQLTHELRDARQTVAAPSANGVPGAAPAEPPSARAPTQGSRLPTPPDLTRLDLTAQITLAGVVLTPIPVPQPPQAPRKRFSPVLVARTYDNIIHGHNGIFGARFRAFLHQYVALIEAKRLLVLKHSPGANPRVATAGPAPVALAASDESGKPREGCTTSVP